MHTGTLNILRAALNGFLSSQRSWGSGANPWGPDTKEDQFYTPNHWDGMLEVVGVTGVMHLGQIQSGLRTATRIAQVKKNGKKSNRNDLYRCTLAHYVSRSAIGRTHKNSLELGYTCTS